MKCGWFDGGDNVKDGSVALVGMLKIFVMQNAFCFQTEAFDCA